MRISPFFLNDVVGPVLKQAERVAKVSSNSGPRKSATKNSNDQDVAELSGEFSDLIYLKPLFLSGASSRPLTPILLKSMAIHLPFLLRYFCKSMPSSWQKASYTAPICITIRLPFVSRYFFRSIGVKGRWDTPPFNELVLRLSRNIIGSICVSLWL